MSNPVQKHLLGPGFKSVDRVRFVCFVFRPFASPPSSYAEPSRINRISSPSTGPLPLIDILIKFMKSAFQIRLKN